MNCGVKLKHLIPFASCQIKPVEVSSVDMENLCRIIQEKLFDVPSHSRSLLGDFEICIGGIDSITSENASVAEISLSKEMITRIARWLGNEERIKMLISPTPVTDGFFGEQLCEQLVRDGERDFGMLFYFCYLFIYFILS